MEFIKSLPLERFRTNIIPKDLKIDKNTKTSLDFYFCKIIYNYNKLKLENIFRTFCKYDF